MTEMENIEQEVVSYTVSLNEPKSRQNLSCGVRRFL